MSEPKEAVCFTAGPKGAGFAAGVIHAWLASDRPSPAVATGISMGALAAAAMERCYHELQGAPPPDPVTGVYPEASEVRRWAWFRTYVNAISYTPLDFVWASIPDPVDFFADRPPVVDNSCPPSLKDKEEKARRKFYRLIRTGIWLSGLRVSVRDVASYIVHKVRCKEQYGIRVVEFLLWKWMGFRILVKLLIHICLSPQLIWERSDRFKRFPVPIPLFGWRAWAGSVALSGLVVLLAISVVVTSAHIVGNETIRRLAERIPFLEGRIFGFTVAALALVAIGAFWKAYISRDKFAVDLLQTVGVARGLLDPYPLQRKLLELFRRGPSDDQGPSIEAPPHGPMHLLIVATPLEKIDDLRGQQVWASPGASLVRALRAALAVPVLYPPVYEDRPEDIEYWIKDAGRCGPLHLVDAGVVRTNPLPALFAWLRKHPKLAHSLEGRHPGEATIHVVYSVPIEAYKATADEIPEQLDIVSSAFTSMELARRRDTRMECRQTNFVSEIEYWIRERESVPSAVAAAVGQTFATPPRVADKLETDAHERLETFPLFADEIAPPRDFQFGNALSPTREEMLRSAAEGCRQTLGRLYSKHLAAPETSCHALLIKIAPARSASITAAAPGLPEICSHCTQRIAAPAVPSPTPALREPERFPHLAGDRPRIVFVASGGVFRGAFHIGLIGAMHAAGLKPDLVVGASVGALMGGALAAISTLPKPDADNVLGELCLTFLRVDRKVALTRTLKNASKQLGIRGRRIGLSPARLRRMIRRGTRGDAGYAVCGAPPALIDAISELFVLPAAQTRSIAAEFVAGHIAKATKEFWAAVREETLDRLDVRFALMGTGLLETVARTLLSGNGRIAMNSEQPYHGYARPVSFFATTSDLNLRQGILLGRDVASPHCYDFVQAALSSAAFPVVFSPRQEAEVLPGRGRTNALFSDGGMFDNLPFVPALEVLSLVQSHYRRQSGQSAYEALSRRVHAPDLFIAGSLESSVSAGSNGDAAYDNLLSVSLRAEQLKVNVKVDSFRGVSKLVQGQTKRLLDVYSGQKIDSRLERFMDNMVPAAVLDIAPVDGDHINGTYAFCASTGLDTGRVALSIADGCYQTLLRLANAQMNGEEDEMLRSSIDSLGDAFPVVTKRSASSDGATCPHFEFDGKAFECPFVASARAISDAYARPEVERIYQFCASDPKHRTNSPLDTKRGSMDSGVPLSHATAHRVGGDS